MKRSVQKTVWKAAAALCAAAFFLGAAGISSAAQLAPPPQVSAKSAALLDGTTGECLYVKNGEQRALIASTTKIIQIIKGIVLPIYPSANPRLDTRSILASSATSTRNAS